ncbi:hypothetical protein ACHAWF_010698 [Thalassiosira exigua]
MRFYTALMLAAASATVANAFTSAPQYQRLSRQCRLHKIASMSTEVAQVGDSTEQPPAMPAVEFPPILEELRDVAMRLHTKQQAPREGQAPAPAKPAEPYVPTRTDYLRFLVDSNAVYEALEEVVNGDERLASFRNTGLERTAALEKDIAWMCEKYDLERPEMGAPGRAYAEELRTMVDGKGRGVPEFVCHYYNFYYAHLAGGRMIGKQMSKLLLDGETLEFYKWDEDVNELKAKGKDQIEQLARPWTRKQRDECVDATAAAFRGGGALNGYLYGGSPH